MVAEVWSFMLAWHCVEVVMQDPTRFSMNLWSLLLEFLHWIRMIFFLYLMNANQHHVTNNKHHFWLLGRLYLLLLVNLPSPINEYAAPDAGGYA